MFDKLPRLQIPILTPCSQVKASLPLQMKTQRLFSGGDKTVLRSPSTVEGISIRMKREILSEILHTVRIHMLKL